MQVIQICGLARAGKSALAALIASHAFKEGYIPVILPFAKVLKEQATALGYGKVENPAMYRTYCQEEGARARALDSNHWVKSIASIMLTYLEKEKELTVTGDRKRYLIIQDDVRYLNELEFGMHLDAYRIFVSRGTTKLPDADAAWRNHESELLSEVLNEQVLHPPTKELIGVNIEELFDLLLMNDSSTCRIGLHVQKNLGMWLLKTPHVKAEDMDYLKIKET